MKIRLGYVSNSSSASFLIKDWDNQPEFLQKKVIDYVSECKKFCIQKGIKIIDTDSSLEVDAEETEYCFGFLEEDFLFIKEGNDLKVFSSLANFEMKKWLDVWRINYLEQ